MAPGRPQPRPPAALRYRLPGRVSSSRSHAVTMVEVHSSAKTVLSVFAAFTASMIASLVKAGPAVSA
jgi:hypothetical protein